MEGVNDVNAPSKLKALGVDVERNLRAPLAGIARVASDRGDTFIAPAIASSRSKRIASLGRHTAANRGTNDLFLARLKGP